MTLATATDTPAQTGTGAAPAPIRVAFVLHTMQVAGAEVLVAETIRRLGRRLDPIVYCIDKVGALGEQMLSEGVPVIAFNRRPGIDTGLVTRYAGELRRRPADVIHAHQYTPFFYSALAKVAARSRAGLILTEHGRHFPDVTSPKRRVVNRWVLSRFATHVNAVCEFSANALAEKDGFNRSKIDIIPNGIDVERYAPVMARDEACRQIGLDPARRYIMHIARFHPVKDHRTLVQGFARMAGDVPGVDLVLVGDGPERASIAALVTELGVKGRVHFLGVRGDVPVILRAADIFTLPSLSEGASITLMEAMAAGVPSVATDVGGMPEIMRHGVDGLLVPRQDPAKLADAFRTLASDEALRARMGAAAKTRAEAEYRLDQTVARYMALYERCMA
jgi:L-malate glycosyltransferase